MSILFLIAVYCLLPLSSTPSDVDKLNQLVQQYNEMNRKELAQMLQAFDQSEKAVKELQDKAVTEAQKNTSMQLIRNEKKRFVETGRLPEVANIIIPRIQYHRSLFEIQNKLLEAYQQELDAAQKAKSPTLATLTRQRDELLSQMPSSSEFKAKTTWKGYRYNLVQRRYLYEFTPTTIENGKFSGVLTTAGKTQLEVEGTVTGSLIQFSIVKVISGSSSPEQNFSGVLQGNRMLLKLQMGGVDYPTLLYLQ
ncbi:MAG TPA: hypothetical protein PLN21_06420 [Gemmatales bacterium]|nr:hypothetical protein [Gemmatales bacterium]